MASSDDTNRASVGISCTTTVSTGGSLHGPHEIIRLRLTAHRSDAYEKMWASLAIITLLPFFPRNVAIQDLTLNPLSCPRGLCLCAAGASAHKVLLNFLSVHISRGLLLQSCSPNYPLCEGRVFTYRQGVLLRTFEERDEDFPGPMEPERRDIERGNLQDSYLECACLGVVAVCR